MVLYILRFGGLVRCLVWQLLVNYFYERFSQNYFLMFLFKEYQMKIGIREQVLGNKVIEKSVEFGFGYQVKKL